MLSSKEPELPEAEVEEPQNFLTNSESEENLTVDSNKYNNGNLDYQK